MTGRSSLLPGASIDSTGTSGAPVANPDCVRCGDSGLVYSTTMRKTVRCPRCTPPAREPLSRREFTRVLTAVEARYRARMKLRAAALMLIQRCDAPPLHLDVELGPTDRIMLHWSEKTGGLPVDPEELEEVDGEIRRRAHYPVLDDATQMVIDRILTRGPPHIDLFVHEWYCVNIPTSCLAKRRGVTRDHLYREWHGTLRYLRRHFEASKHADLVSLVRAWL